MKKNLNIKITPRELQDICKEYEFDEEEAIWEDERVWKIKKALTYLDRSDYIIWCLYTELQSQRKVAAILNVSRTPIARELKKIEGRIKEIIETL